VQYQDDGPRLLAPWRSAFGGTVGPSRSASPSPRRCMAGWLAAGGLRTGGGAAGRRLPYPATGEAGVLQQNPKGRQLHSAGATAAHQPQQGPPQRRPILVAEVRSGMVGNYCPARWATNRQTDRQTDIWHRRLICVHACMHGPTHMDVRPVLLYYQTGAYPWPLSQQPAHLLPPPFACSVATTEDFLSTGVFSNPFVGDWANRMVSFVTGVWQQRPHDEPTFTHGHVPFIDFHAVGGGQDPVYINVVRHPITHMVSRCVDCEHHPSSCSVQTSYFCCPLASWCGCCPSAFVVPRADP